MYTYLYVCIATRDDSDNMVIVLILSFIHHADITLEVIALNEGPKVPTRVTTKLPKQHDPDPGEMRNTAFWITNIAYVAYTDCFTLSIS